MTQKPVSLFTTSATRWLLLLGMILLLMAGGAPQKSSAAPLSQATDPAPTDRAHATETSVTAAPAQLSPNNISPTAMQAAFTSLSEGFDNITTLPTDGWALINNSSPLGLTDWFQGNDSVFSAHSGAMNAYIATNFNNTSGAGTISNWLLTPELTLNDGDTISFWTRTITDPSYPDRLELRLSLNGSSTNVGGTAESVGDFTTLLLSVNPTLTTTGYPDVWTEYTATLSGIGVPTNGRVAFRYFVTNGGPTGVNSDYIGIDTFTITSSTYVWNGSVNSNWNEAANWTPGGPPATTDSVVINPVNLTGASVYPVLEVDPTVNDLVVKAGAELTIPVGRSLTVNGTMVNNGTLRQTIDNVNGATTFLGMGGYGGVEITPVGDMGTTTVVIRGNQACTNNPLDALLHRCFAITPTTPQQANIQFWYTEAERNGQPANSLKVWHYDGPLGQWSEAGVTYLSSEAGESCVSGGGLACWVMAFGVTTYSPFGVGSGGESPTAVSLSSLTAGSFGAASGGLLLALVSLTGMTLLVWRKRWA